VSEYEHNEHLYDEIERLRESNFQLREGAEELKQRIKRLEEAGDEAICPIEYASRARIWTEAKEAKL
jgi:cell division septum initiation protein DivIVA